MFEFSFGDVSSRPGLDLRAREIATIASTNGDGTATPQLKVHINAGLNVGLTKDEIIEIPSCRWPSMPGFPAALNGLFAAKEVFAATIPRPSHSRSKRRDLFAELRNLSPAVSFQHQHPCGRISGYQSRPDKTARISTAPRTPA